MPVDEKKFQEEKKGFTQKLLEEKKISELKLFAKGQVDNSLLPWHGILTDIAKAVPKDIGITETFDERR